MYKHRAELKFIFSSLCTALYIIKPENVYQPIQNSFRICFITYFVPF